VVIRERQPGDDDAIRRLTDEAFGGPYESRLIEDLRAADLAAVELVAVEGTTIAGHILFSTLAVMLGRQAGAGAHGGAARPSRRGIGSDLVRGSLDLARRGEWQTVFVLGHPDYYPRFGFSAELARPFKAPFSGDAFMALELVPGALQDENGLVTYPPAFGIGRG
jgi:putative acetyltransferase